MDDAAGLPAAPRVTDAPGSGAGLVFRPMQLADIDAVAALHVTSWRTAYRGIYADSYLDGRAGAERRAHWTRRLEARAPGHAGIIAEIDGQPAGFLYLIADENPSRGTLLDNLHVAPDRRGAGLGRRLLGRAAVEIAARHWPAGLHLWVFEANAGARRFYERLGARLVERILYDAADGGRHPALCYAWPDAAVLRLD